jgi:PAS domain-containing protein
VRAIGRGFSDAAGAATRFDGVTIDVTDRKRAEEALRENEERLRLGLHAGGVGTWDWDVANDRVTWSDTIYEMYGLPPRGFGGSVGAHADMILARAAHAAQRDPRVAADPPHGPAGRRGRRPRGPGDHRAERAGADADHRGPAGHEPDHLGQGEA